jgi:hypothetical protein
MWWVRLRVVRWALTRSATGANPWRNLAGGWPKTSNPTAHGLVAQIAWAPAYGRSAPSDWGEGKGQVQTVKDVRFEQSKLVNNQRIGVSLNGGVALLGIVGGTSVTLD